MGETMVWGCTGNKFTKQPNILAHALTSHNVQLNGFSKETLGKRNVSSACT